ncbi:MAG: tetratricopeptide repeat protein [Bacteroidota bacterium]
MHRYRIIFLNFLTCLVVCLSAHYGFSQSKKHYYDVHASEGDTCLMEKNYYGAHQQYEKALEYVHDTRLFYKIAEACRMYQNYSDAEKYYKKALKEDSLSYPDAKYHYAQMLKFQAKYDLASEQFKEYYKEHRRDNSFFSKKARNEIEICDSLVKTIPTLKNITSHRIEHPYINSMYSEYSPIQYNDSLFFFGAVRAADTALADTSYIFSNYWNQLLKAEKKDSTFHTVSEIKELQEPGYHIGNLTFNKAGNIAFFTKCKGYECKIHKADFDAETQSFSSISELPRTINKPGSSSTTPHLSVVGANEILFFASDRKGGYGGFDIWHSFINENGSFEQPKNCGKNINTPSNDITPYYDIRDSLLYFSSEWHTSLGGYDVFYSKADWRKNEWSEAQNLGKPVNTSYNDLYYNFSRDSMYAYWVSNRTESQRLIGKAYGNDIYYHPLVRKSITRITDLVPIYLYFDNDHPDPRSRDTVTDKEYIQLYLDYMTRKQEYLIEYTKRSSAEQYEYDAQNIETFFNDLEEEFTRLFLFAELLEVILEDGQDIVIVFKGYASPVGNTDYNEMVAKRRISCIQNFFYEFNDGVLNQYTQNEPGTGKGSLKYGHEPIGETIMDDTFVSEGGTQVSAISDRKQKWMSVYSPAAAYQRKIEIIAVNIEYEDELYEDIQQEIETQKKPVENKEETTSESQNENDNYIQENSDEEEETYEQEMDTEDSLEYSDEEVIRVK